MAACVAGVFSLEDGFKIISKRAQLMRRAAQRGSHGCNSCTLTQVQEKIQGFEKEVSIAAVNGPESIVISGKAEKVREIAGIFEAQGTKVKSLAVSHAFHSPLLEPMLGKLEGAFNEIKLSDSKIPLVSNLTGKMVGKEEIVKPGYWSKHTREMVKFEEGITISGFRLLGIF